MTIPEEIEELENKLNQSTGKRERAEMILLLMKNLYSTKRAVKESYLAELAQLAETLKDEDYRAWSHYYRGIQQYDLSKYEQALVYLQQAAVIFSKTGNVALSSTYVQIGYVYLAQGDLTSTADYYQRALKLREDSGDKLGMSTCYIDTGNLSSRKGNYPQALEYYFKGMRMREKLGDKKLLHVPYNNIGIIYYNMGNYPVALNYYDKALKILVEIDHKAGLSNAYTNVGNVEVAQGDYTGALINYFKSLEICRERNDSLGITSASINIGHTYRHLNKNDTAMEYFFTAHSIAGTIGAQDMLTNATINIGDLYVLQKEYPKAEVYLQQGLKFARELGDKHEEKSALNGLYTLRKAENNGTAALTYYEQYVTLEKELNNVESIRKIAGMEFGYQLEQKEMEMEFEREKNKIISEEKRLIEIERQRSDMLLLNILPAEVAEELKQKGTADAKLFNDVTVLFTDFKSFTTISEKLTPQQLVDELHECFSAFDNIMHKYNIEKIKTVGDAYLAVCGLPLANPNHAEDMVNAALEIQNFISTRKSKAPFGGLGAVRIGIHSGSVVAGIVGVKKFSYDIWGDTVNTAARMEQNSEAGKINISQTTYELVKDKFTCEYRGEIEAKNKGKLKMYFVN